MRVPFLLVRRRPHAEAEELQELVQEQRIQARGPCLDVESSTEEGIGDVYSGDPALLDISVHPASTI